MSLLVILRGNSGSGKTTAAREVRRRYGRGCALVEQDHLRRVVLREHDGNGVVPGFIVGMVRAALDAGYHVILEGILYTGYYGAVLRKLVAEAPGPVACFYLDVSFEETVRRHAGRAEPIPVSEETMRGWYVERDLLGVPQEWVIGESSTFEETVSTVLHGSGLAATAPETPCPICCPRCARRGGNF